MLRLTTQQLRLLAFVKLKHKGQKRKYTGEDYYTHPLAVAHILDNGVCYRIGYGTEIAFCHDLFEDTDCTPGELLDFLYSIGYALRGCHIIVDGVIALTDVYTHEAYPRYNRKKRKKLEAQRLGTIKPDYQTIKYADLLHNSDSIMANDREFASVYLQEKKEILEIMKWGDKHLYHKCLKKIFKYERI